MIGILLTFLTILVFIIIVYSIVQCNNKVNDNSNGNGDNGFEQHEVPILLFDSNKETFNNDRLLQTFNDLNEVSVNHIYLFRTDEILLETSNYAKVYMYEYDTEFYVCLLVGNRYRLVEEISNDLDFKYNVLVLEDIENDNASFRITVLLEDNIPTDHVLFKQNNSIIIPFESVSLDKNNVTDLLEIHLSIKLTSIEWLHIINIYKYKPLRKRSKKYLKI